MPIAQFLFEKIEMQEKIVEARVAIPKYTKINIGDSIAFICGTKTVSRKVTYKATYTTFEQMLTVEGKNNCLPGVKTVNDGVKFYLAFKNYPWLEQSFGVVAFQLQAEVKHNFGFQIGNTKKIILF